MERAVLVSHRLFSIVCFSCFPICDLLFNYQCCFLRSCLSCFTADKAGKARKATRHFPDAIGRQNSLLLYNTVCAMFTFALTKFADRGGLPPTDPPPTARSIPEIYSTRGNLKEGVYPDASQTPRPTRPPASRKRSGMFPVSRPHPATI